MPRATRAAVSRALARSRIGRASSSAYFCIPARSAWPGRGRVSGALRASWASSSGSTGSADMTFSHLGHSVLPIMTATGPPMVSPCRTPPRKVTSSFSNFIRAPRPYPSRRRASASATMSVVTGTPAGSPSSVATSAGPCDSPAVSQRNLLNGAPHARASICDGATGCAALARLTRSSHDRGAGRSRVQLADVGPVPVRPVRAPPDPASGAGAGARGVLQCGGHRRAGRPPDAGPRRETESAWNWISRTARG